MMEIKKTYNPREVEGRIYDFWLRKGYFTPKIDPKRKPFVIIMPPPNITGELHLGHALTTTMEDILTRWRRMEGDVVLWLPGEDHAGIAAQTVVENELLSKGIRRKELGREKFLEKMWEWANKYRKIIKEQHMKLGASCDWTRERFTLDEGPSRAVRTTFVNLYKKGLIYRGKRIINWCPRCMTALSDLEVEHKEVEGALYYIKYRLKDEDGFITVATTRPETLLGDTAVAVNPEDTRYKKYVGREVVLPCLGRIIPVIEDEAVDPSFGTGALKITPAHDPIDFEVGERHNLPKINILNGDGTLNEEAGKYKGLERFSARKVIVEDLKKDGLLEKIEPYTHSVGHCHRCGTMIEPMISEQWFVNIKPLAERAKKVVLSGEIKIIPERFRKVYLNWLEDIRDWCISRQLWWGHRIPVWYCDDCGALTVEVQDPDRCSKCGSKNIRQDEDVLDTWFSSALWTHSTLGWPDDTEDLRYFYPTSVMETGYDILFFWVARMIMMGLENTGKIPFHTVLLHGLIRDEKGEKMSKTRGNVIDPLELTEKYGTDALRFSLIKGTSPGNDIRVSYEKVEGGRNFANKLWNASRFILLNLDEKQPLPEIPPEKIEDRWILTRLNKLIMRVRELLSQYMLGEALNEIYEFTWGEFCDWYIEISKLRLTEHPSPKPVLLFVLENILRLLHPFMPFITEEIYGMLKPYLPSPSEAIIIAPYPKPFPEENPFIDEEAEEDMKGIIELIRTIRAGRKELGIKPNLFIDVEVITRDGGEIKEEEKVIKSLARVRDLKILKEGEREKRKVLIAGNMEVLIPFEGLIDRDEERRKLEKELSEIKEIYERTKKRLENLDFLEKAPVEVIKKETQKLEKLEEKISLLEKRLGEL